MVTSVQVPSPSKFRPFSFVRTFRHKMTWNRAPAPAVNAYSAACTATARQAAACYHPASAHVQDPQRPSWSMGDTCYKQHRPKRILMKVQSPKDDVSSSHGSLGRLKTLHNLSNLPSALAIDYHNFIRRF